MNCNHDFSEKNKHIFYQKQKTILWERLQFFLFYKDILLFV